MTDALSDIDLPPPLLREEAGLIEDKDIIYSIPSFTADDLENPYRTSEVTIRIRPKPRTSGDYDVAEIIRQIQEERNPKERKIVFSREIREN